MTEEQAFAELATGLNEDAKAERRKSEDQPSGGPEPTNPAVGDKWEGPDGKTRYWHGSSWYLKPPKAAAETEEAAEEEADNADAPDPSDKEHPAAGAIEAASENFAPDPSAAVAEMRDVMLELVKGLDKPWHKIPSEQQYDIAKAIENSCANVCRGLVETIAARGQQPVRVLLTKVTIGEKIAVQGEVRTYGEDETDDAIMLLHHARGKHVMVTRATVEDYNSAGDEPETDPDEPEIDFDADPQED